MAEQEIKEIVPYTFDDIYNDIAAKFSSQGYDTSPGSNISQLITSMSYAVSMLNANTAMNVNEMILPYANRRENILAGARSLAYEAKHKTSYVYNLTLRSKTGTFVIPKYTTFKQGDKEYVYLGKQLEIYGNADETLRITVKEGKLYRYTDSETLHVFIGKVQDPAGNIVPQYYIDIPFLNVEEDGIEVLCTYMDEYGVLHEKEQWEKAPSLHIEVDQDPDVRQFFRIDNIEYGTPRIYFRYSGIGRPLMLGTEVFINVLESHGASGAMDLTDVTSIQGPSEDITVESVSIVAAGTDEEPNSDIKVNAPKLHNSSNRLVVAEDYITACSRDQRVKNCVVWGGEDEFPKAPGHIWFSFLPPGTHNFTHDETYSKWTRDGISYEWDYAAVDQTAQEAARDEFFRLNYLPEESIKSPYRNDDGSVANPGIWDRLDALKIPTLVYHHRAPIYCEFSYEIEVAKYLAYDSKSMMHTDMFNIIDAAFSGVNDDLQYENFNIEYFNSNIIKRVDERASDLSGFNMSLETHLVLNERCLAMENLQPEYKDIYIPLAVPFERYFDKGGFLLIDRLPNIDTPDFVSYRDDGPKGRLYTDWSLVRDDIENKKRQQQHKIIYAPIMVQWQHEYGFKDRTATTKVLLPFEVQPDDCLQTGEPDHQYTFQNTEVVLLHDGERTILTYGKDWYWDPEEAAVVRLDALVEVTEDDILQVKSKAQAGWYYLFNAFKKEIMIHLFVDGTRSGFPISLGGDWSKNPAADMSENYLYSYDDYYGYSNDDHYHYTRAATYEELTTDAMSDNFTSSEAELSASGSYIETTGTQPRAFLTTLDGNTLVSADHWYLTTNGYIITDETDRNSYTGPIVREINKYMYLRSPLKYDLFYRNRRLNLKYLSNSFAVIRNVIPVLKQVEFYSLTDDGAAQGTNFIDLTLALQGGELTGDSTLQVRRGITWLQLKEQLKDPSKPYNDFRYWSLEAYGSEIPDDHKFSKDITIYAVWRTQTYSLTFDAGDGVIVPETMSVKAGTRWGKVEDAVKATKEGYVMDGFSKEASGDRISRETAILNDSQVFVRWAEHKMITIKFNSDGGSDQPDLEILSGFSWGQIKDRTQVPTKDGFTFSHWLIGQDRLRDDTIMADNCTLTAVWVERMVEITFDMQGSRPPADAQKVSVGTTWQVVRQKLKVPTRPGGLFLGWSLTNDIDRRDILNDEYQFNEYNYTIYALFTEKICTIRFATNGGTGAANSMVVERTTAWQDVAASIENPVKNNFKFAGWSLTPDGGPIRNEFVFDTNEITLYATWTYDGVVLNFNTMGGTTCAPVKAARGTRWDALRYNIKTPVRSYYVFNAWSFKPDDATPVPDSFEFVDDHYQLYAQWTYNGSKLVFDEAGGSNVPDITVVKGTTWMSIKDKVQPTMRDGYRFLHWSLEPDGPAILDAEVFNDDNEPIWAVWEPVTRLR